MEVLIVMGIVAGGLAWFGRRSAPLTPKQQLKKAKRRAIGELVDGELGRIVGRVLRFDKVLAAPLSGKPCVAYRVVVEERGSGEEAVWGPILTEVESVRFVVEDESGRALVDAKFSHLVLELEARGSSGMFDKPTEAECALLARYGRATKGAFGMNRSLRYLEYVIEEGERVAVYGAGVRAPDPEAPMADMQRGARPTRLEVKGTAKYPLLISDAPETTKG